MHTYMYEDNSIYNDMEYVDARMHVLCICMRSMGRGLGLGFYLSVCWHPNIEQ